MCIQDSLSSSMAANTRGKKTRCRRGS